EKTGRTFRLPREAEWEYACRAGTLTTFHAGDGKEAMLSAGWGADSSSTGERTSPGGRHPPHAWGLYDMHGNVREWCSDAFRAYTEEPQTDPDGGDEGEYRVVRGGSYSYDCEDSRAASRYGRPISYHLPYYGFRVLGEHE